MDRTDRQIVELLRRNGRRSNVEIARAIGVSEGTVRKRVDRLVDEGILRIRGLVDASLIGYPTRVLVALDVELVRIEEAARALAQIPEVVSAWRTTGEHDLLADVALGSDGDVSSFLQEHVATIPGVLSAKVSHITATVKDRDEWAPQDPGLPRVLVVDDDPDFVEVTRMLLEASGYRVCSANSGSSAIAALRRGGADLVILDIMMEGVLDGWDAGRRIRLDADLRDLPILVVSSITSTDYLGMLPTDDDNLIDNFLSKPVDPESLLKEVGRLVRR